MTVLSKNFAKKNIRHSKYQGKHAIREILTASDVKFNPTQCMYVSKYVFKIYILCAPVLILFFNSLTSGTFLEDRK